MTCFTGKIEMGQGPITSLPQMLAEELEVPLDSVDIVMGDTDLCPYDMGTWGSMTTRFFGPALRAAAAEAKAVLLELGSGIAQGSRRPAHGAGRRDLRPAGQPAPGHLRPVDQGAEDRAPPDGETVPQGRLAVQDFRASRCCGATPGKRSPARPNTRGTSACPACSTRRSCGRRPTARSCRASTPPPPRPSRASRWCRTAIWSPCFTNCPTSAEQALEKVKAEFDLPPATSMTGRFSIICSRAAPAAKVVTPGGRPGRRGRRRRSPEFRDDLPEQLRRPLRRSKPTRPSPRSRAARRPCGPPRRIRSARATRSPGRSASPSRRCG